MSDSPTPLPSLGQVGGAGEQSGPPLVPIAIGAGAVIVIIALIAFLGRGPAQQNTNAVDPYAASLPITGVALSTANNFAGQQVTYIEGTIANTGNATVNGALVQVVFHNQLNEVVQKETQRLMVITSRDPYIDTAPLSTAPLKPGQQKQFRLTFEHVSEDWNQQPPEITVVNTSRGS
jgi:hypothetical protein